MLDRFDIDLASLDYGFSSAVVMLRKIQLTGCYAGPVCNR